MEGGNATYFRPPTNRKIIKFHPPPPECTSINTPLPLERKKINHKNKILYRNTQS
jgi:hypothetical protein